MMFSPFTPIPGQCLLSPCEGSQQTWTGEGRYSLIMLPKTLWHPHQTPSQALCHNHHFLDGWRNLIETNEMAFSIYLIYRGRNRNLFFWCLCSVSPTDLGGWPRPQEVQNKHFPSYSEGKRPAKSHNTMGAFQKAGENTTLAKDRLLLCVVLNCFN